MFTTTSTISLSRNWESEVKNQNGGCHLDFTKINKTWPNVDRSWWKFRTLVHYNIPERSKPKQKVHSQKPWWWRPPSWINKNHHNSAEYWPICMKFDIQVHYNIPTWSNPNRRSEVNYRKWRWQPSSIDLNRHLLSDVVEIWNIRRFRNVGLHFLQLNWVVDLHSQKNFHGFEKTF